jgi:pimeloyl-ACP methyl ester carboxylesterase
MYTAINSENAISCHDLRHQLLPVYNKQYEKLHTSLFTKSEKPTVCILFLHGYGSNRLECSNLLPFLKENVAVCCFDFSGSGKSQGDRVTYGVKEKDDIGKLCRT